MPRVKDFFTKNFTLKLISLVLALMLWFYIVDELNRGTEEDRQLASRILPSEGMMTKKLVIKAVIVGRPRQGYRFIEKKAIISPEFCIVVGKKAMMEKLRFAYTMPIDVSDAVKTIATSIALSPIAPGAYMEETFVHVIIPVEKKR